MDVKQTWISPNSFKTTSCSLPSNRQLSIIGESERRLTEAFRSAHPEIDWRSWIDFRNVLVHAYDTIDGERVWAVVRDEIAALRERTLALIEELLRGPDSGSD